MKKLFYTFLVVSIIFSACEKEKDNPDTNSPFSGYWSGKYYEEDSTTQIGIWDGNISSSGEFTGNAYSAEIGTVDLIGTVTNSGIFDVAIGTGDYAVTFYGQLNYNYGSGEWSSSIDGSKGFWEVDIPLEIGDNHQGGIIFYLDENGRGLIAAPSDSLTGDAVAPWGCSSVTIAGANGTAIGTGASNTIDIELGCTATGTAADICANLTLGGYNDWFLPSKDELNKMYLNLYIQGLGGFVTINGIGSTRYWSSTEYNSNSAWVQLFYDTSTGGFPTENSKSNLGYVRAIRAF